MATSPEQRYLADAVPADVLLMVNTLHHIPFADLPRQFGILLRSLRKDGLLVVHEMGRLVPPEQQNVPWTADRIVELLECDAVEVKPRQTTTKGKGVPLAHVLVSVTSSLDGIEKGLAERARAVWREMKRANLETIASLYEKGDPNAVPELRLAMIYNTALDLNPPPNV